MAYGRRTRTVVKNRYQRTGPRATTPAAYRGQAGRGRPPLHQQRPALHPGPTTWARGTAGGPRVLRPRARRREPGGGPRAPGRAGDARRGLPQHGPLSRRRRRAYEPRGAAGLDAGRDGRPGAASRPGLVWYAVVHRHNEHPHVHVIVGASTSGPHGRQEGVRFGRADFQFMREQGDRHFYQLRRDDALLRDAEQYLSAATRELAALLARAVTSGSGGSGGSGPTDRDRIERSRDERDRER